ncbi:MAG: lysylphosphatidylglycerol synthase transmembrane domain-containing protein [Syntrophobacteraceae bacterium]
MKYLLSFAGIGASVLCFWLAIRHVPFDQLAATLSGARCSWLLLALFCQLLAVFARAKLWAALLGHKARTLDTFWSEAIGYLFTNILPLRMGDPARIFALSRRSKLPIVQVAASACIERVFDLGTITLALVALIPWMNVPLQAKRAGEIFGLLVVLVFISLVLLLRFRSPGERLVLSLSKRLPASLAERLLTSSRHLLDGIAVFGNGRIVLCAIFWSLWTWVLSVGMYWCVLKAFRADATLVEATFMVVAICFAVTIPSSPGGIGVVQWVGQQALVLPFGAKYDLTSALAVILTAHLAYYIVTCLLGLTGLSLFGLSFRNLRFRIEQEPPLLPQLSESES